MFSSYFGLAVACPGYFTRTQTVDPGTKQAEAIKDGTESPASLPVAVSQTKQEKPD